VGLRSVKEPLSGEPLLTLRMTSDCVQVQTSLVPSLRQLRNLYELDLGLAATAITLSLYRSPPNNPIENDCHFSPLILGIPP